MDRPAGGAPFPRLRLDGDGRVIGANRAAGEVLEYFAAAGRLRALLRTARRYGGRSIDLAVPGRVFTFAVEAVGDGFELLGSEVTEERRGTARLRQEEARLRSLLAAAPDPIITVTDEGRIDFINARGEALFGFAPGRLAAEPVERLIPDWRRARAVAAVVARADQCDGADEGPLTGVRADGSRFPLELSAGALDRDGRVFVTAIVRDVTEREAAAREIRDLNQRLERHVGQLTTLNAELESFSYSVSHDLRGPLRSIDGFSALLLEEYGARLDEEGRGYLQRVRAATARMSDLIEGLLRLSRITRTELRREQVDLSAIVRFVAEGLARDAPERTVTFEIEEGVCVEGDRALLTVALENLIGNAWKFTARSPAGRIAFGCERHGSGDVFYVRDNGAGFDMAFAGKLFAPFERLHDAGEFPGSGIGLATVARIIQRHGGRVWAQGRPGEGAVFRFTLPS
jgi:PAS domain S-box-containing protein